MDDSVPKYGNLQCLLIKTCCISVDFVPLHVFSGIETVPALEKDQFWSRVENESRAVCKSKHVQKQQHVLQV